MHQQVAMVMVTLATLVMVTLATLVMVTLVTLEMKPETVHDCTNHRFCVLTDDFSIHSLG